MLMGYKSCSYDIIKCLYVGENYVKKLINVQVSDSSIFFSIFFLIRRPYLLGELCVSSVLVYESVSDNYRWIVVLLFFEHILTWHFFLRNDFFLYNKVFCSSNIAPKSYVWRYLTKINKSDVK